MDRTTRRTTGWTLLWLGLTVARLAAQPVLVVADAQLGADYETRVRTDTVKRALHRAGLRFDTVAADDLGRRDLNRQLLAVLPANPSLPTRAIDWLKQFTARGGKLIVCAPNAPQAAELAGATQVGRWTTLDEGTTDGVDFDLRHLASLPQSWRQFEWLQQPAAPQDGAKVIGRWVGGSAGAGAPAAILSTTGAWIGAALHGDDRANESRLLLALVTWFHPELWHVALPRILDGVGTVGDATSLHQVRRMAEASKAPRDRRELAVKAVNTAVTRLGEAKRRYTAGAKEGAGAPGQPPASPPVHRYLPVAELGWSAQEAAEQAYYIAQVGRAGEFRGVWLQQAGSLRRWGWQRIVLALRDNNIKAVFYNVVNGGYANYPSKYLPHVTVEGEDPLKELIECCHAAGIQCHVWMMCNYIRPLTPADHLAQLQADGRLEQDAAGRWLPWLRPSDPRNQEQLANVAREICDRYPLDGLHLDYIRYAPEGDYGPAERAAFEAEAGRVTHWPDDVGVGMDWRMKWTAWRQAQVNTELAGIVKQVRATRPAARVSAAVYPIFVDARYKVGQDPEHWARQHWVDFLCPMNYHTDDTTFYRYLTVQQRAVGHQVPLYPGIAAWRQETPADTIAQIRQLRALGMAGYVLFHLDRKLVREWLPALRLGVTGNEPWLGPTVPSTRVGRLQDGEGAR